MVPARRRLDAELVRRKLARSREAATTLIRAGAVIVDGMQAVKPATMVGPDASIKISETAEQRDDWASRGAHKLLGALAAFEPQGLSLQDKKILDAGASTGGFTDVCLRRGAAKVVAVDVGYGQLVWRLQNDDRVKVVDRTNIRQLNLEHTDGLLDAMVGDLSFISLKLCLPPIAAVMAPGAHLLPMVKPQFEVGKERLGHGGVVRDPQLRAEVTLAIAQFAQELGLEVLGVCASPLPGPSGNVEFFLWLYKPATIEEINPPVAPLTGAELEQAVARAVEEGPQ